MGKLKNKDLISIADLSKEEIQMIMNLAKFIKAQFKQGKFPKLLQNNVLAMIFEKPSTRTRISFEVGIFDLGGLAINLDAKNLRFGTGESIPDIARTMSRYVDGIIMRTFEHEKITKLAQYADIPVINALTDKLHPCQALSDLFTIKEKKGKLQGLKMAYIGDGNNVCSSLMLAAAKVGMEFMAATPKGYEPKKIMVERAQDIAKKNKAQITIVNDAVDAAVGADIVYTDVWASMGQEKQAKKRKKVFKKFQVNKELMDHAKKSAIVMHCLPAHRGEEITADVMDGKQSIVFDQAENRLHVQKAILTLLLEK